MTGQSFDERRNQRNTPEAHILKWVFNVACATNDSILKQLPRVAEYPNSRELGNLLQVGTILASMIRIERHLGSHDYTDFHKSVAHAIAPSVRRRYLLPIQDLAAFLLHERDASLGDDEIPSLKPLLNQEEFQLATSMGEWMVRKLKLAAPSDIFDFRVSDTLGQLVYFTDSQVIAAMVLSDETLLRRLM